jgi:hypothetical protein
LEGVPLYQVYLAALGPKMLELAKNRTSGAHPSFVTLEHTAMARAAVGDSLLAVELGVILDSDPAPWKRLGFTDDDISPGTESLIDCPSTPGGGLLLAEQTPLRICPQSVTSPDFSLSPISIHPTSSWHYR